MTAARAAEAEVKFAQGAKPGKGGQLPGKKVSAAHRAPARLRARLRAGLAAREPQPLLDRGRQAHARELAPPEPDVSCALKYVATHGVEMVCVGGVNAGANRLHLSDGCGGTGRREARRPEARGRAGAPPCCPTVQDMLVEEGVRDRVELSVDGGVQNGEQALKLAAARRRPHRLRHGGADVDRLLDAAPVPPGGPAARRHHRHAPPGLHARRRDPGPAARRAVHRAAAAHHVATCATSPARSASAWPRWA